MTYFRIAFALLLLVGSDMAIASPQSSADKPGLNEIKIGKRSYMTLQAAFDAVPDGAAIYIGPGIYKQAGTLKRNNVTIVGSDGTHFMDTTTGGKATFVIQGNNTTLKNIECSGAKVGHNNGACVRFEGVNLTLLNVYFHDSQSGLLSSNGDRGFIDLKYVRMERIGAAGRAHPIYINGGKFRMQYSVILSTVNEAHGVKSRASETILIGNVIASLNGNDSRLIDIPNGGKVLIRDNMLVEGPVTVNYQILSWGVEGLRGSDHSFMMQNNLVVSDRERGSVLIGLHKDMPSPTIINNVFIGRFQGDLPDNNRHTDNRSDFGFPEAPALPFWAGAVRAIKDNRAFEEKRRRELLGK